MRHEHGADIIGTARERFRFGTAGPFLWDFGNVDRA